MRTGPTHFDSRRMRPDRRRTETVDVMTMRSDMRGVTLCASLGQLTMQHLTRGRGVEFDLRQCHELSPLAIGVISALGHHAQVVGVPALMQLPHPGRLAYEGVIGSGLADEFGFDLTGGRGEYLALRWDRVEDQDSYVEYLLDDWIGQGWESIDAALEDQIISHAYEIYANAFHHAKSHAGVVSCGVRRNTASEATILLTVVDLGVGIPHNIQTLMQNFSMSAQSTLEWAFGEGHTTGEGPRGVGFGRLQRFVKRNLAQLTIVSHEGVAIVGSLGSSGASRTEPMYGQLLNGLKFPGTAAILNLVLRR